MLVYCDAKSCRSNINGTCRNEFAVGMEAIYIHETDKGYIVCEEYQEKEEDDEQHDSNT